MLSPAYMDRKMATGANEAQMSDEPDAGQRADNMFEPVEWDVAASGTHGRGAITRAIVVNGDTARLAGWLGLIAGGALLGGLAASAFRRR